MPWLWIGRHVSTVPPVPLLTLPEGYQPRVAYSAPYMVITCPPSYRQHLFNLINEERKRQDAKWGEQNWPDGTGVHGEFEDMAVKGVQLINDRLQASGDITWRHILREELVEAYAETDSDRLEEELIQCAAVIVNWLESRERQRRRKAEQHG